jgi:hypothetical protein
MRHLQSALRPLLLGLLLASACAVADEHNFADDPIAEVALADGMTVSFYEPEPGALMISQAAPVGVHPLPDRGLTAVELYASLAPGRPVPEALVAAQARSDAQAREAGDAPPARPSGTPSVAERTTSSFIDNEHCDDHWFNDNFCINADWDMCLLNHWNGAYATSSSVYFSQYATCADIGNITLKVKIGDGSGGIWDVLEGHWRSYYWSNVWWNSSSRGDVLNASNNRFHYAVQYLF